MSPTLQIILTSALTIFGGIFVLVVGQITIRFFIVPLHEQRKEIGEISNVLIFYANVCSNPGTHKKEELDKASKVLREKASHLRAKTHMIPCYKTLSKLNFARDISDIHKACDNLIGLSNSVHVEGTSQENGTRYDIIYKSLGFKKVS